MSKKTQIAVYVLLGVLFLSIITASLVFILGKNQKIGDLNEINESLIKDGQRLENNLEATKAQKAALEAELNIIKKQLEEANSNLSDAGTFYSEKITSLEALIAEKEAAIETLLSDIAKYQTVFTIDVRAQAKLIDDIVKYIETSCPYVWVETIIEPEGDDSSEATASSEKDKKEQEPEIVRELVSLEELIDAEIALLSPDTPLFTDDELLESGLTDEELTKKIIKDQIMARENVFYPNISVYYEDLLTGYHFDYNADYVYNSASVIKAPYVLSVLKAVSADEKTFFETLEAEGKEPEMIDTDEDGVPDKVVITYSDPLLDLSEKVVYDKKTMIKDGSGKIKDMEDGTEFTILDFIKYTLEYSDNVAYQQLRGRFKFDKMYSLAREVKANSVLKNGNNMTARDAGKLFKAIYNFIEEDEVYGPIMYESMRIANHRVIIPLALSSTTTLHKYGWDEESYHDCAIVLSGDKPYILTIFSDLDVGGTEIDSYLREVVKMINKLHKGFYSNK